uniref:ATP-dependent DNA helicase n=1 Tax=Acrobeloides nanus TaxID=290746 RepID=A0A914EJL1_9BILA
MKAKRLEELRSRMTRLRAYRTRNNGPLYKSAMDSSNVETHDMGEMDVECIHCGALHFSCEKTNEKCSFDDCCNHGRIKPATADFPAGTHGWTADTYPYTIPYVNRDFVTRLELAQYRILFRRWFPKRVAVPIENKDGFRRSERIRSRRSPIEGRSMEEDIESGDHLIDEFVGLFDDNGNPTHVYKVLPPSSPRYYSEAYEDAMALVRRYGTPDLFITMSANGKWKEIQKACNIKMPDGKEVKTDPIFRPDIVDRVFKAKANALTNDIVNGGIFGKVKAYVSVIEFQMRGLPHMHMLIILDKNDKLKNPQQIDDFISAEIPVHDPELYAIVDNYMIHQPCGHENPGASCMINGKCRFRFPKSYQECTTLHEDQPPQYRRREMEFSGFGIRRKDQFGDQLCLDNRHVAPYNAWLLKKYNCHINVEYVGNVRAVKYLYKYIYKGHDIAQIKIVGDDKQIIYNECERHIQGRYYELMDKSHTVVRLDVHLPGRFRNMNKDQIPDDLISVGQKGSKLEAWLLLLHVKGATSFYELKDVEGVHYSTYKQACVARNLTYDDEQWFAGLREHREFKMPRAMRTFFCLILMYGEPVDPKKLWEEFKEDLSEDFIRKAEREGCFSKEEAILKAYRIIAYTLENEAPEGRKFNYWVVNFKMDKVDRFEDEEFLVQVTKDEAIGEGERLFSMLNEKQRKAVNAIMNSVEGKGKQRCFFIDGPGGTGKTFIYKTLYYLLQGRQKRIRNMATTGIAATLLPEGMTAHKTFALDVPLRPDSVSRISSGTIKGNVLAATDVFFLDEAPMMPKYGIENMDDKLRELKKRESVNDYLARGMRLPGINQRHWGTENEIIAFTMLFGINVYIWNPENFDPGRVKWTTYGRNVETINTSNVFIIGGRDHFELCLSLE